MTNIYTGVIPKSLPVQSTEFTAFDNHGRQFFFCFFFCMYGNRSARSTVQVGKLVLPP